MKLFKGALDENHPEYQKTQELIDFMKKAGWDQAGK
jgi:hypothetical protein